MKTCFKCGVLKGLYEFYQHSRMRDGYLNKCKECSKEDVRRHRAQSPRPREYDRERYYNDPVRREYTISRANVSRRRDPLKYVASTAVNNAIRDGRLVKPETCSQCGERGTRIEAHHDDYSKPLEVRWLCVLCHRRQDHGVQTTPF